MEESTHSANANANAKGKGEVIGGGDGDGGRQNAIHTQTEIDKTDQTAAAPSRHEQKACKHKIKTWGELVKE